VIFEKALKSMFKNFVNVGKPSLILKLMSF